MRKWLALLLVASALIAFSAQGLAVATDLGRQEGLDNVDGSVGLTPDNGDDDDDDDEDPSDDDGSDDNSGSGNGDDDDEDDEDDEDEDDEDEDEEREVKVEVEDHEVTIKLESKGPDQKDEVKVHFDADEGQMKVSFEREASAEEEVEMRVTFHRVIEFEDADGDGAYSPLDDDLVREFFVEGLAVEDLTSGPFEVDGKVGQRIMVNYTFPGAGNFSLVFWVFGQFAFVNGVPVRPSEAKIDIHIEDFPFLKDESLVAVDLIVKTEFEIESEDVTADELIARGEEHTAFFRWASEATVDDVTKPVNSTLVSEKIKVEIESDEGEFENRTRLFLTYARGAVIVHDPTVGIAAVVPMVPFLEGPSLTAFGIGVGTVFLLVLGVWAFNRRRR